LVSVLAFAGTGLVTPRDISPWLAATITLIFSGITYGVTF